VKRQRKILPRLKIQDNRSADNETASRQEEKPKQNDEPEQKASVNDNEEAGGNQSNAGNGGQTTDSPKDNVSNPQPASVAYSPQNVVSLATAKCQAGGMITTQQNLLVSRRKSTMSIILTMVWKALIIVCL